MRGITPSLVSPGRLARYADRAQRAAASRGSRDFERQLTSALKQPGETAAAARAAVAQRQTIAVSDAVRQNPAADSPPISPFNLGARSRQAAAPAAPPPAPVQAEPPAAPAVTTPAMAMDVLHAALRQANFEPSGLNLYYEEIPVYYPGGSYVNRLITLDMGPGRKESFDVGLMLKNPWLTALEIRRTLGMAV